MNSRRNEDLYIDVCLCLNQYQSFLVVSHKTVYEIVLIVKHYKKVLGVLKAYSQVNKETLN